MSSVLEARDLRKSYVVGDGSSLHVLKGVQLAVRAGETVAIIGASGSGKSTLLHLLGGLDRPTDGEVTLDGRPLSGLPEPELARVRNTRIGFVFQFHHLLPDFTAVENVLFPAYAAHGRERPDDRARAERLLDRVGLRDRAGYRATKLSGGQKQRVAVARAVMMRPDLVLADEPTGNLDSRNADEVMRLLRELAAAERTAFIISTHEPRIASACNRVIRIVDGRLA
jgi:lipoprotein-releasing system ATP-binding protein